MREPENDIFSIPFSYPATSSCGLGFTGLGAMLWEREAISVDEWKSTDFISTLRGRKYILRTAVDRDDVQSRVEPLNIINLQSKVARIHPKLCTQKKKLNEKEDENVQ